jgi:hypothetical protein
MKNTAAVKKAKDGLGYVYVFENQLVCFIQNM